jgi:hypothetical protein
LLADLDNISTRPSQQSPIHDDESILANQAPARHSCR